MKIYDILEERNSEYEQLLKEKRAMENEYHNKKHEIDDFEVRIVHRYEEVERLLKVSIDKILAQKERDCAAIEQKLNKLKSLSKEEEENNKAISERARSLAKELEEQHNMEIESIEELHRFESSRNRRLYNAEMLAIDISDDVGKQIVNNKKISSKYDLGDDLSVEDRKRIAKEKFDQAEREARERMEKNIENANQRFYSEMRNVDRKSAEELSLSESDANRRIKEKTDLDTKKAEILERADHAIAMLREDARNEKKRLNKVKDETFTRLYAEKEALRLLVEKNDVDKRIKKLFRTVKKEVEDFSKQNSVQLTKDKIDYEKLTDLPESCFIGNRFVDIEPNRLLNEIYGGERITAAVPVELDVRREGNIIIRASGRDEHSDSLYRIVCGVIMKYMQSYPVGSLKVNLVDRNLNMLFAKMKNILPGIVSKSEDIDDALDITERDCEAIITYLVQGISDVYDLYEVDKSQIAKINLVVIKSGFGKLVNDANALRRISNLMSGGRRSGARFLIVDDIASDERISGEASYLLSEIYKNATVFNFENNAVNMNGDAFELVSISDQNAENYIEEQCGYVNEAIKKLNRPVTYEDIGFGNTVIEDPYDNAIAIPVGKTGNRDFEIVLASGDSPKGDAVHFIVAGTPGSGKSSLFHSIIMNGAMKYSPSDLQFWLLDFKEEGASSLYEHANIPHIGLLSKDSKPDDGYALFRLLDQKRVQRQNLFKKIQNDWNASHKGEDGEHIAIAEIADYNRFVDEHKELGYEHLPRIVVLIDEAQFMITGNEAGDGDSGETSSAQEYLRENAKKICEQIYITASASRSTGIHIILVLQNFDSCATLGDSLRSHANGRIVFKIDYNSLAGLEFGYDFTSTVKDSALNQTTQKGLCYATNCNGIPEKVQMAYCNMKDPKEIEKYLSAIRKKHQTEVKTIILGERDALLPESIANIGTESYDKLVSNPLIYKDEDFDETNYEFVIGEDAYSLEPTTLTMNRDGGSVCILGKDNKSSIASSICISLLKAFASMEYGQISLCNGKSDRLFQEVIEQYANGADIVNYSKKNIDLLVQDVYEQFLRRKEEEENGIFKGHAPIFAIVSGINEMDKIQKKAPLYSFANNENKESSNDSSGPQHINKDSVMINFKKPSFNDDKNISLINAITRLCTEGCKYNIFFNFASDDETLFGSCISKMTNVIAFNSLNPLLTLSKSKPTTVNAMLSKIKSPGGAETMALKINGEVIYKIRPVIYKRKG